MCACMETDVRESANDCILASGEGHGSRGETLHPICAARPVSSSSERSVYQQYLDYLHDRPYLAPDVTKSEMFLFLAVIKMGHDA
jgi:hypothetical protein